MYKVCYITYRRGHMLLIMILPGIYLVIKDDGAIPMWAG